MDVEETVTGEHPMDGEPHESSGSVEHGSELQTPILSNSSMDAPTGLLGDTEEGDSISMRRESGEDDMAHEEQQQQQQEEEQQEGGDAGQEDLAPVEESGPSLARQRWQKAYRKAKFAKMFTDSAMALVMKDRTGASLLDLETGSSLARKQVEDHFRSIQEYRDECERTGRYKEAKAAAIKMNRIRETETQRRREEMERSHTADMIKVETLELKEAQQLTSRWNAIMDEFEQSAARSEAAMSERHQEEHRRLHRRIFGPLENPKWSTHLLNLRTMQEKVAAQNNYQRAHEIQQKANTLQAQEMHVMEVEAMSRHETLAENLDMRHEQEKEHFQDRVDFGRRKRDVKRSREFKNLETRFRNVKLELQRIQEREKTQLQQAVDHSIGLGKNNISTDIIDQEEMARPATAPMRSIQHAYDWNVRFGNKAGNASTITTGLGLSAVAKGETVLQHRRRSGRAHLAVASPTMPQPHHGSPMPFYLEPSTVPHIKPLKPASGCSRIAATNPREAALFRKAASASDAAIDIYKARPHTAPVGATKPSRPGFASGISRPRTRGRMLPSTSPVSGSEGMDGMGSLRASPRDDRLERSASDKGLDNIISTGFSSPRIITETRVSADHLYRREQRNDNPSMQPKRQAWRPPNLTGIGSRPPGAGAAASSRSRPPSRARVQAPRLGATKQ